MILMLAPAPNVRFGAMPSGVSYTSDQYGLIHILNDSAADQAGLQSVGCWTLQPFGGWGNFGFQTLADLYAADTGTIIPDFVGYPQFTVATVFADGTSTNDGTWYKTGTGNGSGNWTQLPSTTVAALAGAVPWLGKTWCQVSQLKFQLAAESLMQTVLNAIPASPLSPVNQQWFSGGIVTTTGPLGVFLASTLGLSSDELTTLFQNANAQAF